MSFMAEQNRADSRQEQVYPKCCISAIISNSPRTGSRQRLVCEMSPGADNHRGRIPTLTVALDLRCLHGDERGPRLGAGRAIGEQTKKCEHSG